MGIIDTLITDRTQSDVDYVEALAAKIAGGTASADELAEWNGAALRGAYNHTDLNRVGLAIKYIAERLTAAGYTPAISPKTDWKENEWPTEEEAKAYLADLEELRSHFTMLPSTPPVPADMEGLALQEANAIEQILQDIEELLRLSLSIRLRSGQPLVFSGFAVYPMT